MSGLQSPVNPVLLNFPKVNIMRCILVCFIIFVLFCSACKDETRHSNIKEYKMEKFSEKDIDALSRTSIFFGHMSVGFNIISGIEELKEENNRLDKIYIQDLDKQYNFNKSGIYHAKNGKNGIPISKCEAFKNRLRKDDLGKDLDIAFFKFCYVDFNENTDIDKVFNYYVDTINELKEEFPRLQFVHVTTPLYAHLWGIKGKIKNILMGDASNVKRNEYNNLLLSKYYDNEPVFDLARIESTYPDSSRESFRQKDLTYYSLINEYTYDGGHLNEFGKKIVAHELLSLLTKLLPKLSKINN